ncbi:MAG: hypothetical protein IMZ53_00355 [Thermoplasmata archaeon]|nr:hypothetical protein [Thermoplasmata archaeon]
MRKKHSPKNIIVISDTHCGCGLGLCPPIVKLDDKGTYHHSPLQAKVWEMWQEFWNEWVPMVTKNESYIVVHNGDAIDGIHHNATTQITHNIERQRGIAVSVLEPIINNKNCAGYYHIRGTEAHVGQSGEHEEELAKTLNAIPDRDGRYARWELWLRLQNKSLIHFTHHVGTTSSAAYEGTAVYKELVEAYNEAGRWGEEPPDCVVRSHRHRQFEIRIPTDKGYGIVFVTPGWQLKTPFVFRTALGRSGNPQIGGYLLRSGDEDGLYTRFKIWKIGRESEVKI